MISARQTPENLQLPVFRARGCAVAIRQAGATRVDLLNPGNSAVCNLSFSGFPFLHAECDGGSARRHKLISHSYDCNMYVMVPLGIISLIYDVKMLD